MNAVHSWLLRVRPAPLASALKRLLRVRRRYVSTEHGTFYLDPASNLGRAVAQLGHTEPHMLATIDSWLPEDGVFVDVGANEGYFTVVAGRRAVRGRVVAIEPQTRLRAVISRNIEANGLHDRVTVHNYAISDVDGGFARLHLASDVNTGSSSLVRSGRFRTAWEEAPVAKLQTVLAASGVERVDLMKIDVEGFEWEAILGSLPLFKTGAVRAVIVEFHPSILAARGLAADDLRQRLIDCGYAVAGDYAPTYLFVRRRTSI